MNKGVEQSHSLILAVLKEPTTLKNDNERRTFSYLPLLDYIPALNKVLRNVQHDVTSQCHMNLSIHCQQRWKSKY